MSYPYAEHDNGVVLTQPRPGEFERRPMTAGELAAREPALKIAKDIYRHANQAGVCYYEFWRLIADAIDACARPEELGITQNDKRWRILEHGCQWVSWTPTGGETHSFDPRDVKELKRMRAWADETIEKQLAILRDGIASLPSPLAPIWPDPEDWNLVCPKCGASPEGPCGWQTNCATGLAKRQLPQGERDK